MDNKQRLQLSNMIKANNVEDQTGLIRNLRHSQILRNEINNMIVLKAKYRGDDEKIYSECVNGSNFLFTYYTDIFNKLKKDEIDLAILTKLVNVLKLIEDGRIDQHEGSFEVGTLLKKIYIDSALRKAEKLNAESDKAEPEYKGPQVEISWKQFKTMKR